MTDSAPTPPTKVRGVKVSQTEFPNNGIRQASRIAQALWDDFAGKSAAPHQIAMAIDMSPTSGSWRNLTGSSIAFGLTEGGYNAAQISLTDLGRRIVAPLDEGDDATAKVEAILRPRVLRDFFQRYDKAKFPKDDIAQNVLVSLGLPKDRAGRALDILKEAGQFAGVLHETKGGLFVALGTPSTGSTRPVSGLALNDEAGPGDERKSEADLSESGKPASSLSLGPAISRVFITHGKNAKILDQVKQIVQFGRFDPIVAQERETTSKPVPQKVLDDMRSCQAAVIHVGVDSYLLNESGEKVPQLNGNVLIEIGAAMALYKENFVLLVEDGVSLPSNLQGLYECRYSGDELGMEATMKLLKSFNEFR